jgi:AraC family transcriptional regulator
VQVDEDLLAESFGRSLVPRLMHHDTRLLQLAQIIADDSDADRPTDPLFTDSLGVAFLTALMAHDNRSEGRTPLKGGLAPWRLRRAIDYLRGNLAGGANLTKVAELVGLSKSHFCREFKASTGLAPHTWLLHARIDHAKDQLLAGRLSIAEVALELGFADQSHLTRTFTRMEKTSPAAWMRHRGYCDRSSLSRL